MEKMMSQFYNHELKWTQRAQCSTFIYVYKYIWPESNKNISVLFHERKLKKRLKETFKRNIQKKRKRLKKKLKRFQFQKGRFVAKLYKLVKAKSMVNFVCLYMYILSIFTRLDGQRYSPWWRNTINPTVAEKLWDNLPTAKFSKQWWRADG